MHVVDAAGANVVVAQATLPPGAEPVKFVIGASPVFDTATVIVAGLPMVTDGPGAEPAGWPLTEGEPTVNSPAPPEGAPV